MIGEILLPSVVYCWEPELIAGEGHFRAGYVVKIRGGETVGKLIKRKVEAWVDKVNTMKGG